MIEIGNNQVFTIAVLPGRDRDCCFVHLLKTYGAKSHAHHFCVGKQGKLFGSCLLTIYEFRSIHISDFLMSDPCSDIFLTK